MPHHPAEENTTGNITDQVAKESKDSTASSHKNHDVDTGVNTGIKIHSSTPGPVIPNEMPEAASKEELKARSEELNKK